ERAQRHSSRALTAANKMQLIVKDKNVLWRAGLGVCLRLEQLYRIDLKETSKDFVHRQECGGHASRARQKSSPVHTQLLTRGGAELIDSRFNFFLPFRLGNRHVFAIGDHPCRYRRWKYR